MLNPSVLVLVVIAVVMIAAVVYKHFKSNYKDIDLKIPETRRNDLLYGYYSSLDRTYNQVKDHVNLFWFSHFFPVDQLITILRYTHCKVVVDLSPYLFEGEGKHNKTVRVQAETDLRNFFIWLQAEGVLDKVSYLYPMDEPNLFCKDEHHHLRAIQIVKAVRQEFYELQGSKLAVLYAGGGNWMNLKEFDVVGVDNYEQKSYSLTKGDHADLVKAKLPHQKTFIVPGPAFGHAADPWVAYALLHPEEVEAVVPFIWFDDPNHKDTNYTGLEALPQEFRDVWIEAGHICVNVK